MEFAFSESLFGRIAHSGKVSIQIHEKSIAVLEDVRGACEILGLDPLYVANQH